MRLLILLLLTISCITPSFAAVYLLSNANKHIIGKTYTIETKKGDDFNRIARRYDIGYWELRAANPSLDALRILPSNTTVIIPASTILPATAHKGIVINLAELRMFYYKPNSQEVYSFPVGIGQPHELTPVGHFYIKAKIKEPSWHPPQSSRDAYAKKGIKLPKVVPAGPANPLGHYAMHLNIWNYLIHGTNQPNSVGKRSSAGCIHMYPEDIKTLFNLVKINTPVTIINKMYKATWQHQHFYLEAEQPLLEQAQQANHDLTPLVKTIVAANHNKQSSINWTQATQVGILRSGIPTEINGMAGSK